MLFTTGVLWGVVSEAPLKPGGVALEGAWGVAVGGATNPLLVVRGVVLGGAWGTKVGEANSEPLPAGGVAKRGVTSLTVLACLDDADPETCTCTGVRVGGTTPALMLLFREGV